MGKTVMYIAGTAENVCFNCDIVQMFQLCDIVFGVWGEMNVSIVIRQEIVFVNGPIMNCRGILMNCN